MNIHIVWVLIGIGWTVTVPLGLHRLARLPVAWIPVAWIPVAGFWALTAAVGGRPLGYSDETVLLTAAHFVHAGFGLSALLVVAGLRTALLVHQVGMVTVAAGIAGIRLLEPIGTGIIVIALVAYSAAALRRAAHTRQPRRALLVLSAVAWWFPMLLAAGWSSARVGVTWIDRTLDEMVTQHGAVNAIGLVLAGLAGHPRARARRAAHSASLRRPDEAMLAALVEAGAAAPITDPPGLLVRGGRWWFTDTHDIVVGHGDATFEAAAASIRQWVKFRQPWTTPAMPLAPIEPGATVGYAARVMGVWWSCCCRIVDVIDDRSHDGPRRYGFTYATIAGHPERGEERFLVTLDPATDEVRFEIVAMSRPGRWFTWLGLPIARRAQARFRAGAGRALVRSVASPAVPLPNTPTPSRTACPTSARRDDDPRERLARR